MGFYAVASPSNASTFCLLQAIRLSSIHCSIVSLCHTPTLEFHGLSPDDGKRQHIEFSLTDTWMLCNKHD
jgi:hypothetical protein